MRKSCLVLTIVTVGMALAAPANAAIIMMLTGTGGPGLLTSNVPSPPASGGSGDALTLDYNPATNVLTYDVRWGSGNTFTDLSSTVTVAHIHGPTASVAPTSFGQNAGVAHSLLNLNTSATNGGANGTWMLTEPQEVQLFAGQFYFNIHTSNNPGGEIRGNIVPEPSWAMFWPVALLVLGFRRRR